MCGRYSLSQPTDVLARLFSAHQAPGLRERYSPSFNIAPTTDVLAMAADRGGTRVLDTYRWGLVPSWAPALDTGRSLFNARAESLSNRPAFSEAFASRRLVLLADGFFEWRRPTPGRPRQPLFFRRPDGSPLPIAGLWDCWTDPSASDERRRLFSCTMITVPAGADLDGVHDRMPMILEPATLDEWLDPTVQDVDVLADVLRPAPPGTLVRHPVDPRVGDVRNDDASLIRPFEPSENEPLRLFS